MTYNPSSLRTLGAYWVANGGVNLGVVGNTAHTKGYHLGRDRIYDGVGPGIGDNDYSVKTSRDRTGLTDAASAIDLGTLNGLFSRLRTFSVWLVGQARINAPGTSDLREIIYSPDGVTVLRWDRERGFASDPRPGEADASHLTHTHISWYRDAENRDHTTAFRPFFEGDMDITAQVRERWHPTVTDGQSNGVLREKADRSAPVVERVGIGEHIITLAEIVTTAPAPNNNWRLVERPGRPVRYALRLDWDSDGILDEPVDCSAEVDAATDPLNAQIVVLQAQLAAADEVRRLAVEEAIARTKASAKPGVIFEG